MSHLGILLAAGYGRRFAAQLPHSNKLLSRLPDGRSVAATSLHHLLTAVEHAVVVIRPNSPELQAELQHPRCTLIESQLAHTGMGASLADAANTLLQHYAPNHAGTVVVALADMPCIPEHCYHAVQDALHTFPIAAPSYQNQRGHPVGFQWPLLHQLCELTGDEGARHLIKQHGIHLLPCDDAGVCFDIDEPADLTHALLAGAAHERYRP